MVSGSLTTPVARVFDACTQLWLRAEPVRDRVRARFTVDARSLAAIRIALGLILIVDLVHRFGSIEMFYTDNGAYPFAAYELTYTQYNGLSVHALSGDLWFQQLLFVVAALFAVAFVLGYRTRLVGVVSLVLLFSLHARNPAVLNGGDRLLRVLLFVALVTPLGERWSIDALRRGSARRTVASFGTAALLVQPLVVFTANAIEKHGGDTWYAGEALGIALANDVMTVYLGNVLVDYPPVLTALNYAWVTLLAGSVVFLLLPVGRVRAVTALAYIVAFLGMLTAMAVGMFPLALAASVLPFLPAVFWDTLTRYVPDRWAARLPDAATLGPLRKQPVEHRLLDRLRNEGYEEVSSYAVAYGRSLVTVVGFLVLVWILVFAGSNVSGYDVPDEIDHSHVDQQSWGLYAPDPSTTYSWYVPQVDLANGSSIDARTGGEVDLDRPPDASAEYDTFRHRKFMQAVRDSDGGSISQGYADWMCRQASQNYDVDPEHIRVYRLIQSSPVDGAFEDEPRRQMAIRTDCADAAPE